MSNLYLLIIFVRVKSLFMMYYTKYIQFKLNLCVFFSLRVEQQDRYGLYVIGQRLAILAMSGK